MFSGPCSLRMPFPPPISSLEILGYAASRCRPGDGLFRRIYVAIEIDGHSFASSTLEVPGLMRWYERQTLSAFVLPISLRLSSTSDDASDWTRVDRAQHVASIDEQSAHAAELLHASRNFPS